MAVVYLLFAETGTSVTAVSAGDTAVRQTVEHHTLLEHEGPSVLIVLAIPLVLAAAGAAAVLLAWPRALAVTLAVALGLFCVAGAMSIGLFFVPAAAALGVAVGRSRPRRDFVTL